MAVLYVFIPIWLQAYNPVVYFAVPTFVHLSTVLSTYHIVVAFSPAESKHPVNMAMFSPASFLSLLLACCNVRACAIFSAQDWASLARSSAHVMGGTPCSERNWLCTSRHCFGNASLGHGVEVLSATKRIKNEEENYRLEKHSAHNL